MSTIVDVLIVDDDQDWRERMRELVEDRFSSCQVASEKDAMALIKKQYFHFAIVDKSLILHNGEDEGGMRILKTLKELDQGTGRLMLTSYGSIQSARDALKNWDASDYLEKKLLEGDKQQEIRNQISQMILNARQDYQKRFGSGIEQIRAGFNTENWAVWETDIIMAISMPGKRVEYKDFKDFINSLVNELSPLIPYENDNPLKLNKDTVLAEGNYWSKGLGQSVKLIFGRVDDIDAKVQSLSKDAVIQHVSNAALGGLVIKADLSYDDLPGKLT
jgi:ActR/RegA family two-component response regulator